MLEDDLTACLGTHPDEDKVGDIELIDNVADRLKTWLKNGISKEERVEILKLVPRKGQNINMDAPKLNEEIKLNLKDDTIKRDRYFFYYQNLIGSSLSLTSMVLSIILDDKVVPLDRDVILQCLGDAVKIKRLRCFLTKPSSRNCYLVTT